MLQLTLHPQVPVWFAAWFVACGVTWSADRTGDRAIHIIVASLVSGLGNALVAASSNVGVRFFGMFLVSPIYLTLVLKPGKSNKR